MVGNSEPHLWGLTDLGHVSSLTSLCSHLGCLVVLSHPSFHLPFPQLLAFVRPTSSPSFLNAFSRRALWISLAYTQSCLEFHTCLFHGDRRKFTKPSRARTSKTYSVVELDNAFRSSLTDVGMSRSGVGEAACQRPRFLPTGRTML